MTLEQRWQARLAGKRLLIFDFDGTVADTSPLHASAFAQVLAPRGVPVDYASIAGLKTADAMRKCLAAAGQEVSGDELAELVKSKQAAVRGTIAAGLTPLPGVDDFLRWARDRFHLAMVTSGSKATIELSLAALGYRGVFDPLVTAEDVSRSKPDPEGFLRVLATTGHPSSEAMVFEDSAAGVEAAARAGIDCWDVVATPLDSVLGSEHAGGWS